MPYFLKSSGAFAHVLLLPGNSSKQQQIRFCHMIFGPAAITAHSIDKPTETLKVYSTSDNQKSVLHCPGTGLPGRWCEFRAFFAQRPRPCASGQNESSFRKPQSLRLRKQSAREKGREGERERERERDCDRAACARCCTQLGLRP